MEKIPKIDWFHSQNKITCLLINLCKKCFKKHKIKIINFVSQVMLSTKYLDKKWKILIN